MRGEKEIRSQKMPNRQRERDDYIFKCTQNQLFSICIHNESLPLKLLLPSKMIQIRVYYYTIKALLEKYVRMMSF